MEEPSALVTTLTVISLFFICFMLGAIPAIISDTERIMADGEREQRKRDKELEELNEYLEEIKKL